MSTASLQAHKVVRVLEDDVDSLVVAVTDTQGWCVSGGESEPTE